MTTPAALKTAEDLLRFRAPDRTAELVRGVLIVRDLPDTNHGARSARVAYRMSHFVERHALGEVFAQNTGFKIGRDPDTVRTADVAFVSRHRLDQVPENGYADIAPDLVAEILSAGDRPGEVLEKVGQWLSAGVQLVWALDPARRQARVYRTDGSVSTLAHNAALDGEQVLSGFLCPLVDLV